jgi:hypothetical protein
MTMSVRSIHRGFGVGIRPFLVLAYGLMNVHGRLAVSQTAAGLDAVALVGAGIAVQAPVGDRLSASGT